jgi:hypothetical protein
MQNFTDVFISYGRKESKSFATKLYQTLIKAGYSAWFDQNDIPLGVDYQNQIDDGIEKAHNFIFIIAPHAVASPYCRLEVELAAKRGKRIIPILHTEGFDFDKLHPIIGKINWIYSREQLPSHENSWEKAVSIDDFDKATQGLFSILGQQQEYVKKHTEILYRALEWEQNQQVTQYLLVGKERQEAEKWLLTEFKAPTQAPCEVSDLHATFICESKKNANNLMTDVFLCSPTANTSYELTGNAHIQVEKLIRSVLSTHCITTWQHHTDIQKGEDIEKSILEGIEQADNFLFFITKAAVVSPQCLKELEYATLWKKRVIPLLVEEVPMEAQPKEVQKLHAINFVDNDSNKKLVRQEKSDFEKDISELLKEIQIDATYHNQHKVFLVQALKWQRNNKNNALLLQGYNLQNAQTFIATGKSRTQHPPTRLHKIFIAESIAKIGQLSSEVFISYSRTDGDFARRLNNELQALGKTTWFDQESIATGADFQKEIYKGIENSDNFLFIISDKSLESPFCDDEVKYAAKLNKRFVTVLTPSGLQHIEALDKYPSLAKIQWIDFRKKEFEKAFFELVSTLNTDREYIHNHTKYTQKANDWFSKNKSPDLLLQGEALFTAKEWIEESEKQRKKPSPTQALRAYIGAGELAWTNRLERERLQKEREKQLEKEKFEALEKSIVLQKRSAKRQRYFTFAALLLAGIAIFSYAKAYFSQKEVIIQSNLAHQKAAEAAKEKIEALQNAEFAKKAALEAENERLKAQAAFDEMNKQRNATEEQRKIALRNLEQAKINEEQAKKAKEVAVISLQKAIESETKARDSEEKAQKELTKSNQLISFFGFGDENRAWAYKNGKFALIDKEGKQFSEFIYNNPSHFEDSVALVELNNDYAIVNLNGDTIAAGYEFFIPTNAEVVYTKKNNQYGFVDRKGNLLPNRIWFDNNWIPDTEHKIGWIKVGHLWGLADKQGKVLLQPQFTEKNDFQNGLAKVKKHNLFGVINNSGIIVIEPNYDKVAFFDRNYIQISKRDKKGVANEVGEITIPLDYDEIIDFDSTTVLLHQNNLWGLANKNGLVVTPPQYDEIKNFTKDGLVDYEKNGKWGLIDDKGRVLATAQFDDIEQFTKGGMAAVKQKDKWGFISKQGKILIVPQYDNFEYLTANYAKIRKDNLWGLIDTNGKVLLPPIYQNIEIFDNTYLKIHQNNKIGLVMFGKNAKLLTPIYDEIGRFSPELAKIKQNNQWCVINKQFKIISQPQFDELFDFSSNIARYKKDNLVGYVNNNGKIIGQNFEEGYDFFEDIAPIKIKNKWTFITAKGQIIAPPQFDEVYSFSEGLAGVKENEKWSFFQASTRKKITKQSFDEVGSFKNGMAKIRLNNFWGFINQYGQVIVEPIYDMIEDFLPQAEMTQVLKNGKIGFVNRKGEVVFVPQFDKVEHLENKLAFVLRAGKYGMINATGKFIVVPQFDEIKFFQEGLAAVRLDEKWGYVNTNGKMVIDAQFDTAENFEKGKAKVTKYGEIYYINREGKMLIH